MLSLLLLSFVIHSVIGGPISASRVYSSADCNDAGERKIGKYSVNDCATKCVQTLPNTRFIAYGKGGRSRECYCEYTSTCSRRGRHGSFDVYKLNFSVSATRRYISKDCNDAGEVKIGKFTISECASKCLAKYPNTRWLAYGKGGRARECYCEKSRTCGKRGNHGSFDVYQINKPLLKCTGGDSCCTSTSKCGEGGGDCDSDSHCNSGLKCGVNNCKAIATFLGKSASTFDSTDDCCYKPGKSYYKKGFTLFTSKTTFSKAKSDCVSKGGQLATPRNSNENNAIKSVARGNKVWLGANDIGREGQWKDIKGNSLRYTYWQPGEPNNVGNEDCVEMYTSGRWNDLPCTRYSRAYVCRFGDIPKVDCVMGGWKPKGSCSKKCGGGKQTFERSITKKPSGGGKACTATTESRNCNTQKCPIDCKWNSFGSYGKCSALCDGGYQTRSRTKKGPFYGGKACSGNSSERKSCGTTPCYKVTNCGTLAAIYAKTKGKLLGEVTQRKKNLAAFNKELALAKDEVSDGEKLLALVKTLPNSSSKTKIQALVAKCLADARKALASLSSKIKAEEAAVKSATDKINKLEHSAKKCQCDAQTRQLRPLVQKADQKIIDNTKAVDAIDKMLANLLALNTSFQQKIDSFAFLKSFGGGLYEMMTKTFKDMMTRTTTTINALKAKRKVMLAYNTQWKAKIAGYNKQMKDCQAQVALLAKKLKALLVEFGMMDIWEEYAQQFEEMDVIEEGEELSAPGKVAADNFTQEQEEETESTNNSESSMQNVFAAIMIFGGIGGFIMGHRSTKSQGYESLV